jgi:hypothetical protein
MVKEIAFSAVGLIRKAFLEDPLIFRSERGFLSWPPGLGLVVGRLAAGREATIGFAHGARGKPARPRAFPVGVLRIIGGVNRPDHHHRGGHRNCNRAGRASKHHDYPPASSLDRIFSSIIGAPKSRNTKQYIPPALLMERATNRCLQVAGVRCIA